MVELELADYCQNCPEIDPVADVQFLYSDNEITSAFTHIKCQHAEKCIHIVEYLDKIHKQNEVNKK